MGKVQYHKLVNEALLMQISDNSWVWEICFDVCTLIWPCTNGTTKFCSSASVIERLEKSLVDEALAFFYCDFGKEESTDVTEVIHSLLYQLLHQYYHSKVKPGAPQVIHELHQLAKETFKGDAVLKNITHLSSLLSCVAGQFCHQPLIIIDALDECKETDRLLCALLGLKTDGVRLLVSSHPIQAIKHRFGWVPSISIEEMAEAVSADIKLHVNREVESHLRLGLLDPMLKWEVCSILHQKSNGMSVNCLKFCFLNSISLLGFGGFSVSLTLSKDVSPFRSSMKH